MNTYSRWACCKYTAATKVNFPVASASTEANIQQLVSASTSTADQSSPMREGRFFFKIEIIIFPCVKKFFVV
jgi:hypothetical protein